MSKDRLSAKQIAGSLRAQQEARKAGVVADRGDLRKHVRRACNWPSVLHVKPYARMARVEDISVGGCRLNVSTFGLECDTLVVVEIPGQGLRLDGIICWKRGDEIGVNFEFGEESRIIPAME